MFKYDRATKAIKNKTLPKEALGKHKEALRL